MAQIGTDERAVIPPNLPCQEHLVSLGKLRPKLESGDARDNFQHLQKYLQRGAKKAPTLMGLRRVLDSAPEYRVGSNFLSKTLVKIVKLALEYETAFRDQPLVALPQGVNKSVTFTRRQVACLLANMFLCTGPHSPSDDAYPDADMYDLLNASAPQEIAKLTCFISYFEQVTAEGYSWCGSIWIWRNNIGERLAHVEDWTSSSRPLRALKMCSGGIEDSVGSKHADFANKYIGGGVLSGGCVQEEIRFSVSPELCVSMLICPFMLPNEAIHLCGSRLFTTTKNYGFDLEFHSTHTDRTPLLGDGTAMSYVCAMDAEDYRYSDSSKQFDTESVLRELRKSVSAFENGDSPFTFPTLATGNWGCGVFLGDLRLKSIIQWLSASECGLDTEYYFFNATDFAQEFESFRDSIMEKGGVTVGQLAAALFSALTEVPPTKRGEKNWVQMFPLTLKHLALLGER